MPKSPGRPAAAVPSAGKQQLLKIVVSRNVIGLAAANVRD
jgi:hypothetical protein